MAVLPVGLFPLMVVKDISILGPFSSAAICAVLYTSIVIAYHGFEEPDRNPATAVKAWVRVPTVPGHCLSPCFRAPLHLS